MGKWNLVMVGKILFLKNVVYFFNAFWHPRLDPDFLCIQTSSGSWDDNREERHHTNQEGFFANFIMSWSALGRFRAHKQRLKSLEWKKNSYLPFQYLDFLFTNFSQTAFSKIIKKAAIKGRCWKDCISNTNFGSFISTLHFFNKSGFSAVL